MFILFSFLSFLLSFFLYLCLSCFVSFFLSFFLPGDQYVLQVFLWSNMSITLALEFAMIFLFIFKKRETEGRIMIILVEAF